MSQEYKRERPSSSVKTLSANTLHSIHCCVLFTFIAVYETLTLDDYKRSKAFDPWTKYGAIFTIFLYLVRYINLLSFPKLLFDFGGLVVFNAFPPKVQLRGSPIAAPFICFRTVTRGGYPILVKDNLQRNIKMCEEVGLENFHFEVVTDKSVNLTPSDLVREIVVPDSYRTKRGTLFKARALQYCLEDDVNILADNDWIVHLDEETLMTVDSLRGILNFVCDGRHKFGQGMITYCGGKVVNWFTTLMDCFRVGEDMGKIRFSFKMFHKPLFAFKGSFMVIQVGAERHVSFDHGLDGSVTEDSFMALKAYEAGYSFDFIDGYMMEKSPFTIFDFLCQRRRWARGAFNTVFSRNLPVRTKICFWAYMCTYPFQFPNLILSHFFPIPCPLVIDLIFSFMGAITIYLYIYGTVRSFSLNSYSTLQCVMCVVGCLCVIPFGWVVEYVAVVWAILGSKHAFYIINKDSATLTKTKMS